MAKPKPSAILVAVAEAEEVFWAEVARHFPEITTGDFTPQMAENFTLACVKAVMAWVAMNAE